MSRFVALLAAAFALFAVTAHAADSALSDNANAAFLAANAHKPGVVTRPSGLQYSILRSGYGKRPAATDVVTVYYSGSLINGTVFDATEAGFPANFTVNQLIPGWTEALELMREGDHWQVVIPSDLAYGARGAGEGKIPPNQVLVFDLELIKVAPPPKDEKDQSGSQQ
jgi:FKBP-type peptidyl-prolyl cis-trans isomerase FklB